MIRTILLHLQESINQYFKQELDSDKTVLVLSNLVNSDGGIPKDVENKLVFFLVGLSEETTLKNNLNRTRNGDTSFSKMPQTLHFNLQLLFCSNFEGISYYNEGLAYLSSLIRFFQINKVMMVPNYRTDLSKNGIESMSVLPKSLASSGHESKVSFELCKLDYSELSHLWSAIGGKLKPSALYKVGIVSFDDAASRGSIPSITDIQSKS